MTTIVIALFVLVALVVAQTCVLMVATNTVNFVQVLALTILVYVLGGLLRWRSK